MLNPSERITKSVILFASKHSSQLINQAILQAFDGLIKKYVYNFHKKYPEIEIDDLNQIARERALICIQKWTPKGDSFSFPKYLKQALFFGLRRYCHEELRHLKCMPINRDAPLMLKEKKIELGLDSRSTARLEKLNEKIIEITQETQKERRLKLKNQRIDRKIRKFIKEIFYHD